MRECELPSRAKAEEMMKSRAVLAALAAAAAAAGSSWPQPPHHCMCAVLFCSHYHANLVKVKYTQLILSQQQQHTK